MRDITLAIILAFVVLSVALALAFYSLETHDQQQAQLRNAYWPFTVETSIKDK